MTLGKKLVACGGRPSGFDYLRITLAICVVIIHTGTTGYGIEGNNLFWETALRGISKMVVPMFFALSGFLVAGSLQRSDTLTMFVGLRIIRIFPALTVEVLLSALILGPLFTNLLLLDYFSDPLFLKYLLNVTGHVSFYLPGVFTDNPEKTVNSQLWTVPFELYCYIALSGLIMIGLKRRESLVLFGVVGMAMFSVGYAFYKRSDEWYLLSKATPGLSLVTIFLTGVAFHLYREKIRWSTGYGLASAFICYTGFQFLPGIDFFIFAPLAYLTVWIGLMNPSRNWLIEGADYSYGVYLYSFPIQQMVASFGSFYRQWFISFPISLAITTVFAAFSWHLIEKPFLSQKSTLRKIELRLHAHDRKKRPA
ncbi:acyltransferase [Bradyrhizobium sp. PRIMUS42]|uniref:acyltransferase family protein n=1 Tax=Bradyrhizobium sp. PRIMUS42 TaxID=2908926 RepID=UPI001FF6ACA6|nr:acyltransferase [Bradyrhizobium sp. PRIMUS42]MCJ9729712.1 acyltransferase [Bradyrhizobium sp. PRIMUS42]